MPIDSNIILGIRPPKVQVQDPLEQYGRAMQLKSLLGQQQLQGVQIEQATRANEADKKLRELFSGVTPGTDMSTVLPQVYGIDPKTGMSMQQSLLKQRELQGNIDKTAVEVRAANAKEARDTLAQMDPTNPSSVANMLQTAKARGWQFVGDFPQSQDPNDIAAWQKQHMFTADKAIEQQNKDREFAESKRHHGALEGYQSERNRISARGQDMTDQRQRELNGILGGQSNTPSNALIDQIGQNHLELPKPPTNTRNPIMLQRYGDLLEKVKQKYPGWSQEQYPTVKKAEAEFATGKSSQTIQALSNATGHLDTYERLALAMKNGDSQAVNSIMNKVREQFGSSAPTNPALVSQFLAAEIVKAASGAAGGVSDREHMASIFANKNSPEQMTGAADTAREIMGQQFRSLEQKYKAGTYGRSDFADKYLTLPEVRAAYDRANKVHQTIADAKKDQSKPGAALPNTNAKGWALHVDAQGNKAYVSPDGKQYEELK